MLRDFGLVGGGTVVFGRCVASGGRGCAIGRGLGRRAGGGCIVVLRRGRRLGRRLRVSMARIGGSSSLRYGRLGRSVVVVAAVVGLRRGVMALLAERRMGLIRGRKNLRLS